jgi:hypothetical protein
MQQLSSNPRVGDSRPVPNGTLTLLSSPGAARRLHCSSACLQRRLGRSRSGSVRRPRQRSPGAGVTRVSDGSRGTPTTRQRWWGRERSDRIRARSAAMGEGAQRPKVCRLCRPPKRSEVPKPLMPFLSFRRIWSFSGRSAGLLLVYQRKDVSTLLCQPDPFHCPRVDTGLTLARLFAGFGLIAVHAFSRCMAPRGHGAAKQRRGVPTEEWTPFLSPKRGRSPRL